MKIIEIAFHEVIQSTINLQDEEGNVWFMFVLKTPEGIVVKPTSFSEEKYLGLSPIQRNELCITAVNFFNENIKLGQ